MVIKETYRVVDVSGITKVLVAKKNVYNPDHKFTTEDGTVLSGGYQDTVAIRSIGDEQ